MSNLKAACVAALFGALLLSACDGQQYVSPDTVQLLITKDGSTLQLVNRCNYVPVLLGSVVKVRYVIEDDLKATLTLTRDAATVSYDDGAEPFKVSASELADGDQIDPQPPPGYAVTLSLGCTPQDP
jgi:hypothetical protein